MASEDGESPAATRAKILMWAEFSWRLALGEFPLTTRVRDLPVVGMKNHFGGKGWSILDLFSLGNPHVRQPAQMAELAFGRMLHMVQDSFAGGHAER
jgi:hypothetical protein